MLTVKAIETPPKYGTGAVCVFRSRFGASMAPIRIAKIRIGAVINPDIAKAATPKITNWPSERLMR